MPLGDKTGPVGSGSKSGRALGYCSGYDTPGYMNNFYTGRGRGRLRGFGRGMMRGGGYGGGFRGGRGGRWNVGSNFYPNLPVPSNFREYSIEDEKNHLEILLKESEENIKELKKRLEILNTKENSK